MSGIEGKVALVTGASRGIGEGIAHKLAAEGARLAISARKPDALSATADAMRAEGHTVFAHPAHNGKLDQVDALLEAVEANLGPVEILVNNVGTNIFAPLFDVNERLWDSMFATNVKGHFFLSQKVGKSMVDRRSGGVIVNVSSVSALKPKMGMALYSVTKAAMNAMTRAMAAEWGGAGVRVNAVGPGVIDTKFSTLLINTPAIVDGILAETPLNRIGEVDDVAEAVTFLCRDEARHITGHFLTVDGGMSLY